MTPNRPSAGPMVIPLPWFPARCSGCRTRTWRRPSSSWREARTRTCSRRLTSWTYCSRAPNAPSACAPRSMSCPCGHSRSIGKGKTAHGLAALQKAVELARPGGFVRVFVDLGSPMRTMLLRLAGRGFALETIRRIVAAFPEPPTQDETSYSGSQVRAANAALVEPLSGRELEVLALFRDRLSNQEIAKQLCISTNDREASHGQPVWQARCQRPPGRRRQPGSTSSCERHGRGRAVGVRHPGRTARGRRADLQRALPDRGPVPAGTCAR